MKIQIKKINHLKSEYTIIRADHSIESFSLDTKTYLLHDVVHYVVEKNTGTPNGFWGLLAAGHSFTALFGKDNELTKELRLIEQIVGPVQSTYLGHINRHNAALYLQHTGFKLTTKLLDQCLNEITTIISNWDQLSFAEHIVLEWNEGNESISK